MTAPPRVVCFDLGGVVIPICRSWREACEKAGVPLRFDFERSVDTRRLAALVDRHQTGRITCDDFFVGISELAEGRFSADEVRRIHDAWILGDSEGMAELIDRLHVAGLESACLSNTNPSHWSAMRGIRAFDAIRHRHASHLLGHAKPGRDIYRAFESQTGFAPESILFFDDLVENVLGAAGAGWRAVLIDPSRPATPQVLRGLKEHGVELG